MHPLVLFGLVALGTGLVSSRGEKIPGGRSSGFDRSRLDARALRLGKKIEMEHTCDPETAEEISADHLVEFHVDGYPDEYYDELVLMERRLEKRKAQREAQVRARSRR